MEEVDAAGRTVRVVTRAEMRSRNLRHRAVFVLVTNRSGEVLVHRRSDTKDVWPGWWDLAIGGVVLAGEEWDAAAVREVGEELGVTAVPEPWGPGGSYEDDDVRLVGRTYRLEHEGPFSFADGEVVEARFVSMGELRRLVREMPFLPDSVALLGDLLGLD